MKQFFDIAIFLLCALTLLVNAVATMLFGWHWISRNLLVLLFGSSMALVGMLKTGKALQKHF